MIPESAESYLRLTTSQLNTQLLQALGSLVTSHSGEASKPLEVDLRQPLPFRLRIYIYNATFPPGGRTLGERKIQLIVPGQVKGERADFDFSDGRIVMLMGYEADLDVFVLWDAGTYRNFPHSMNVQVAPSTVFSAFAGNLVLQRRHRRTPSRVLETVVAAPSTKIMEAITSRITHSLARMLQD